MDVTQCILDMIGSHRRSQPSESEVEIRLGSLQEGGRFVPGVSKEIFYQLERDFTATLETDDRWFEIVDYHYLDKRDEPIRTRVEYNTENIELKREHICKRTNNIIVFQTADCGDEVCKVTQCAEIPILDPPWSCMPTHVRIKQRKQFHDIRCGRIVWTYELSKTWSANTRGCVEHLQTTTEPVYEVECELVDIERHYTNENTDMYIANSIIAKSKLLMG